MFTIVLVSGVPTLRPLFLEKHFWSEMAALRGVWGHLLMRSRHEGGMSLFDFMDWRFVGRPSVLVHRMWVHTSISVLEAKVSPVIGCPCACVGAH